MSGIEKQKDLFPDLKPESKKKIIKESKSPFAFVDIKKNEIVIVYGEFALIFRKIGGSVKLATVMSESRIHDPQKKVPSHILDQAFGIANDRWPETETAT